MGRKTERNIFTTPELIKQINPKNQKLVDKFIRNFRTKSSAKSVEGYISDYNIFFCWNILYNENKFFIDLKKSELIEFFNFTVDDLGWGGSRYRRMHSALNSFSNFIENVLDDDYPNFKSLLPKIEKIPKTIAREKTVLSDEQVDNLLDWILNTKKNVQWACFLSLAINSGLRISELLRFKVDSISEDNLGFNDMFLKTTEKIKCKGRGKNGYMDYKYILKESFLPIYYQWIEERKKFIEEKKIEDHGYLFISRDGTPITEGGVRRWFQSWEKYLTEEEPNNESHKQIHFYCHLLKHYAVSNYVKAGLDSKTIGALIGWHSADVGSLIALYDDTSVDDKNWEDLNKLEDFINKKNDKRMVEE